MKKYALCYLSKYIDIWGCEQTIDCLYIGEEKLSCFAFLLSFPPPVPVLPLNLFLLIISLLFSHIIIYVCNYIYLQIGIKVIVILNLDSVYEK